MPAGALAAPCTAPAGPPDSALRPVKPVLPQKPACLDAKGGCPGWEAYTYSDAVKAYNAEFVAYRGVAEAYVKKLKDYADGAVGYANCEVKALQ